MHLHIILPLSIHHNIAAFNLDKLTELTKCIDNVTLSCHLTLSTRTPPPLRTDSKLDCELTIT